MGKKIGFGLVGMLVVGLLVYGCARVQETTGYTGSNPNMNPEPASPPSGTTAVKLSGGNVSASETTVNFNLVALDQNDSALTNITKGNLQAEIWDTYPTAGATSILNVSTQGLIQATFDDITSGANVSKPIAVAMTLDKSGSMGFDDATYRKVTSLEIAAENFVDLCSLESKIAVVMFDSQVSVEVAMRTIGDEPGRTYIKNRIATREGYGGSTAIYKAIHKAMSEEVGVSSTSYYRAILAMTDGQDNASGSYTEKTVTTEAITLGLPIYTVGLFDSSSEASYYRDPLVRIATATTGTSESYYEIIAGITALSASADSIRALGALTSIYQKLAQAFANSYSVKLKLSSSLTSGQQYWLKLNLSNYGSFSKSLILTFYAQ